MLSIILFLFIPFLSFYLLICFLLKFVFIQYILVGLSPPRSFSLPYPPNFNKTKSFFKIKLIYLHSKYKIKYWFHNFSILWEKEWNLQICLVKNVLGYVGRQASRVEISQKGPTDSQET